MSELTFAATRSRGGSFKLNALLAYQAVVYAAGVLLATGLITDWGEWYSPSSAYRNQTDALLRGELALSDQATDVAFDHTWSENGVHQVWGLGVPAWRLPFEAAARLFGFEGFPDRIAFGLFALLVAFVVLRVWVGNSTPANDLETKADPGWAMITGFGAGFLILLLFPPFLNLLQTRGAVWDEAVGYEYLYAVLQVTLLLGFARRPTLHRWLILAALAGLGPLVRPPLLFYGAATMLVGALIWWNRARQQSLDDGEPTNPIAAFRGAARPVVMGGMLFCLGGGLLWLTNVQRFGDGFEFGHKLNVQTLYGSMYATRFDDPYQDEPLPAATRELFGALFRVHDFKGSAWYARDIFSGQSDTIRWREFYNRTYDLSFVPLILLGWGMGIFALVRAIRRKARVEPMAWLGVWSLVAFIPLAGFYLYTPVISSRYLVDLAPAFAVAIAVLWWWLTGRAKRRWSRVAGCLALLAWLGVELFLMRSSYGAPRNLTWEQVKAARDRASTAEFRPYVNDYGLAVDTAKSGIPFDRTGWDSETGALKPLVILFVKNAEFLELELEARDHPDIKANPEDIRAKVGLELLRRSTIHETDGGWRVRFHGPVREDYRIGLETAFIATVPKEHLASDTTPWILKSVRWREGDEGGGAVDSPTAATE